MHPSAQHSSDSYPIFDWLRFVLASAVVLTHAGAGWWGNVGDFSVCVFFSLSGWLIGGILLKTNAPELPKFFFNRSIRIWIPYAVAIALLYCLAAAREGMNEHFFKFLFYDLTFTHYWFIPKVPEVINLMPLKGSGAMFWSISVEEQFYLLAPLVILFAPKGRSILVWVALSLLALAFNYHYASIALGVLAAVCRSQFGNWHSIGINRLTLMAVTVGSIFTIVISAALYKVFAPMAAIGIVLLCAIEGKRSNVGQLLGGVSYPLYLNHYLGIFLANAFGKFFALHSVLKISLSYIFAFGVGLVLYLVVDRWVLQHKQSAYSDARGKSVMIVAYGLICLGVVIHFLVFE